MTVTPYPPQDLLHLWWLGRPEAPVLIGDLRLVQAGRGVSLRYDAGWLQAGFALSEDLPLIDQEFLPTDRDTAAGAVDDARPDRWGERVIRLLERPARLSLMEFLYLAGDERFGALGVSVSRQVYEPRQMGPLPRLQEVDDIAGLIRKVADGEPVPEAHRRLLQPGVSLGGARPKALLEMEDHAWVLKFGEAGDATDSPLVEHAAMTLAGKAGLHVAPTRAIALRQGHAVAVRRFDREAQGRRRHALSAHVALRAAGEGMGYPELAQLLRRRGAAGQGRHQADMRELFARMVFNILMDNTDDHEKNHALLLNDRGEYELSPAFDVLPAAQALGYQQMRVGHDGHESTLANAMSEAALFGLSTAAARQAIKTVAQAVDNWRAHFAQAGVKAADIEWLAAQIDRPFLKDQRRAWC